MSTDTSTPVSHDELVRLNKSIHTGSFISRLTTGTGAFDIIGKRRYYYMFSTFLVVASILLIVIRGFNLGTDFAGGTTLDVRAERRRGQRQQRERHRGARQRRSERRPSRPCRRWVAAPSRSPSRH